MSVNNDYLITCFLIDSKIRSIKYKHLKAWGTAAMWWCKQDHNYEEKKSETSKFQLGRIRPKTRGKT